MTFGSSNCSPKKIIKASENMPTYEGEAGAFPHLVDVVISLDLDDPDTTFR